MTQHPTKPSVDGVIGTSPVDIRARIDKGFLASEGVELRRGLAYQHAADLRGLSLSKTPEGWRAVIKVATKAGRLVAFVEATTYEGLLDIMHYECNFGTLRWYPDRFP